jgi:protein SCO1/2
VKRAVIGAIAVAFALLLSACSGSSGSTTPAAASGAGACAAGLNDHTDATYCGLGLTPPQPRPQFTVTDMAGKPYLFANETAGKPTLLFFGYTTCPDVCPTTMADIAQALRQSTAAIRQAVQVVFVSTDPKTDTLPVIKAWLDKFDPDLPTKFIGLRGTDAQVHAAEAAAHVTLSEDEGQTHSAEVLLYGADDYARVAFLQSDNEAADMSHDLAAIVGKK